MDNKYTEKSFGLSFLNGQWGVMEVRYSLEGEVSQEMIFTAVSADKNEAIERFKILVSELFS